MPPFARLFDDASQFPPGNLELGAAVDAHARWREGPRSELVGRFLTPAARAQALAPSAGADWELGLVVGPGADASATAAALAGAPAAVTSIEIALSAGPEAIDGWRAAFPAADCFVEGAAADVEAIAGLGAKAKIRCGGATAAAVPSPAAVAAFLAGCAARELPFKATAGLHQPLRHHDADLGTDAHGFLNLLAATAAARAGARQAELERLLHATRVEDLGLPEHDLDAARELFEAFGTCSIQEPLDGLAGLGLLDG